MVCICGVIWSVLGFPPVVLLFCCSWYCGCCLVCVALDCSAFLGLGLCCVVWVVVADCGLLLICGLWVCG